MFTELGQQLATQGIAEEMDSNARFCYFLGECFGRYSNEDWGDMCEEDIKTNNDALKFGERIFASYNLPDDLKLETNDSDSKIWIITEWDRSVTTVLFPSEY